MNYRVASQLQWTGFIIALITMICTVGIAIINKPMDIVSQIFLGFLTWSGILGGFILTQCPIWLAREDRR